MPHTPLENSASYFIMVMWGNTNQTQNYFGCVALSSPTWNLYLRISIAGLKYPARLHLYYQTKLVALSCLCSFRLILS